MISPSGLSSTVAAAQKKSARRRSSSESDTLRLTNAYTAAGVDREHRHHGHDVPHREPQPDVVRVPPADRIDHGSPSRSMKPTPRTV